MTDKAKEKKLKTLLKSLEDLGCMAQPADYPELIALMGKWHQTVGHPLEIKRKDKEYAYAQRIFNELFQDFRKCILTERMVTYQDDKVKIFDLNTLKSMAHEFGVDPAMFGAHFTRWYETKKGELIIDLPEWNGKDSEIRKIAATLYCKDMSVTEIEQVLREWMSGVWRRYLDNMQQNRLLLLRGDQGIGKDFFVRHLLTPLQPYVLNFTMTSQEKDVFQQASGSLVVNMSEFDQTEKYNPAFLKDLITKYEADFRPAYGRTYVRKDFHCSFIGTTNKSHVLRDETGNRRFIIIDLDNVDGDKFERIDWALAWSEARAYMNYKATDSVQEMINEKIIEETPDNDLDERICEAWEELSCADLHKENSAYLYGTSVERVLIQIKQMLGLKSAQYLRIVLNKNGYKGAKKINGMSRKVYFIRKNRGMPSNLDNLVTTDKFEKR